MKRAFLGLAMACSGPAQSPDVATTWAIERLFDIEIAGIGAVDVSWRSELTDWIYLWSREEARMVAVNGAYVQPVGDYCIGEVDGETCLGELLAPGQIETRGALAVCPEDTGASASQIQESGVVLRIGTSRAEDTLLRFHRSHDPATLDGVWGYPLTGPCSRTGDLLAASTDSHVVLLALGDGEYELLASWETSSPVAQLAWLDGFVVTREVSGAVSRVDPETLQSTLLARGARALATDSDRGRLAWLDGDGRPNVLDREATAAALWPTPGWEHLTLETRTGSVHLLQSTEQGWRAGLASAEGLLAAYEGSGVPEGLVAPGAVGDLVVRYRDGAGPRLGVFEVRRSDPDRPPLHVFAMSTLEEPFDDRDRPCSEGDEPFDRYLAQLRANVLVLETLGVPMAIGVTREFIEKSEECGDGTILEDLVAAGFELGVMTHGRPCFSCTDGEVEGVDVAWCSPDSSDYRPPKAEDACWPDDPEYCAPGDQLCWEAWLVEQVAWVDERLPGGGRFIHGMDRHALWDFDWIRGLHTLLERDEGPSFDTTLFAGSWSYPQLEGVDDPRGKEPLPWTAEGIGRSWFPARAAEADRDSAFSELAYLPGNSVATIRVSEWQRSGLTVLQTKSAVTPQVLDERDFEVQTGLLHQALARRTHRPGTWYFHLRDLTTWRLEQDDGSIGGGQLLEGWLSAIDARWVRGGEMRWSSPSEARDALRSSSPEAY